MKNATKVNATQGFKNDLQDLINEGFEFGINGKGVCPTVESTLKHLQKAFDSGQYCVEIEVGSKDWVHVSFDEEGVPGFSRMSRGVSDFFEGK